MGFLFNFVVFILTFVGMSFFFFMEETHYMIFWGFLCLINVTAMFNSHK